ncbi:UNKNOWN [Stylonychia lemnae]|uniref:Uncharacterized protein n=1 Tax=Stylonychia lemnae TaxID=5949 RepID=A0A078AFB0_STYLE|nr:UNKNOWN [Stylonychia lemnae]|eukprot:CDW80924.1 UNKNOWN [Stylonychia lemnae]
MANNNIASAQEMLFKPLRLNSEYLTQRKIQMENKSGIIVQEYAFKDNWLRLSRGLSNFRVTDKMTEKRQLPQKVVKVKEKVKVVEDNSFEGLLLKIANQTENILEQANSPMNKPKVSEMKQNSAHQGPFNYQQKIEKNNNSIEKESKSLHIQNFQMDNSLKQRPRTNLTTNNNITITSDNDKSNTNLRYDSSQTLDQKEIININIDTALNNSDGRIPESNQKNMQKRGRKLRKITSGTGSRQNQAGKNFLLNRDKMMNQRAMSSYKNYEYASTKQTSTNYLSQNARTITSNKLLYNNSIANARDQVSSAARETSPNSNPRVTNILRYQTAHYQKFIDEPRVKMALNSNKLNLSTPNKSSIQNMRMQSNYYQAQSFINQQQLNQFNINRNFTHLDQSVNFVKQSIEGLDGTGIANLDSTLKLSDLNHDLGNQPFYPRERYHKEQGGQISSVNTQEFQLNNDKHQSIFDKSLMFSQNNALIKSNNENSGFINRQTKSNYHNNNQIQNSQSIVSQNSSQRVLIGSSLRSNYGQKFIQGKQLRFYQNKYNSNLDSAMKMSEIVTRKESPSHINEIYNPQQINLNIRQRTNDRNKNPIEEINPMLDHTQSFDPKTNRQQQHNNGGNQQLNNNGQTQYKDLIDQIESLCVTINSHTEAISASKSQDDMQILLQMLDYLQNQDHQNISPAEIDQIQAEIYSISLLNRLKFYNDNF